MYRNNWQQLFTTYHLNAEKLNFTSFFVLVCQK